MESEIKGEIVKTYYPTLNDFKNFKGYMAKIEKDVFENGSVRAAKVSRCFSLFIHKYYSEFHTHLHLLPRLFIFQ